MGRRFILDKESDLFSFLEDNRYEVNNVIFESLRDAIMAGYNSAILFSVGFKNLSAELDIIFELPDHEYKNALDKSLTLFEEIEDYTRCIICRDLITMLEGDN
jgi:hypothetical protein